jgi:ParB family chromosome partitioning protein
MQNSGAFQFLTLDTIHESATNPRRTFEESKLHELAESIRQHGLIQPITVRPHFGGFEIVAGARRYRAEQLAELFAVPARIVEIDDAQALEWAANRVIYGSQEFFLWRSSVARCLHVNNVQW